MGWVGIFVEACGVVALFMIYKTFSQFVGPDSASHGEQPMSPDDVWEE